jgi:hypothetical protein
MRVPGLLLIPIVALAACGGPSTVTAPTPTPTTTPTPTPASLIGTISEWTPQGERPLSGAYVWALIWPTAGNMLLEQRRTDANGEYNLSPLARGVNLQLMVSMPGYYQQCAAPQITVGETLRLNAQLIAEANVSASRESVPPSPPGLRIVTGVIYAVTAEGRRATANGYVEYEGVMDPFASTKTDAQGRFLLCGLPQSRAVHIGAYIRGGGYTHLEVLPGPDATLEIEVR